MKTSSRILDAGQRRREPFSIGRLVRQFRLKISATSWQFAEKRIKDTLISMIAQLRAITPFHPKRSNRLQRAERGPVAVNAPFTYAPSANQNPLGQETRRIRAFKAARKHTRLVRMLRIGLPAIATLLIAIMLVPAGIKTFSIGPVVFDNLRFEDGALVMERPRLTGENNDHGPYVISAERAAQDAADPSLVRLYEIEGDIGLGGTDRARISAARGKFQQSNEKLELTGDVRVVTTSGYDFRSPTAYADFEEGTLTTNNPVDILMLNGTLRADNVTVRDGGELIVFDRVRIVTRMGGDQ